MLLGASGFKCLAPNEAIAQQKILDVIRHNYELAGYAPIETPLVERTEILTAKGGGEIKSQIYGLRLLNPAKGAADDSKDLALRFDQTVPLARFVAANYNSLSFPFRRYVIGPVFRGERAKDGRYRQFIQADIDAVGNGSLDLLHDAEMVSVISRIFNELSIGPFTVRIGNRKILEGLLEATGLSSKKEISDALSSIDQLEKVGRKEVLRLLSKIGIENTAATDLLDLLANTGESSAVLANLKSKNLNPLFKEGVEELEQVVTAVKNLSVSDSDFVVDISIARGLDYYTGTVYETRLDKYPDIGSIASGGRYENLASTFTSRKLPGVGISIGVTRLLFLLIKEGLLSAESSSVAPVLITTTAGLEKYSGVYLNQANRLREAGIPTEVYLAPKDLGKQLQFANAKGFKIAVVTQEDEIEAGTISIKDLATRKQITVTNSEFVNTVKNLLQ